MFALIQSLLRRFSFGEQASRPTAQRRQVPLTLEALGERILPSASPFNAFFNEQAIHHYPDLQINPALYYPNYLAHTPNLMGPMQKGSTIDLGLGTLTMESETYNWQTGATQFTGEFEAHTHIYPAGFSVSDDISSYSVSGTIGTWSSSSGTSNFNGSNLSYYTNTISFSGTGDGSVGALSLPDHQTVSFNGSVLSVWTSSGALPVGVSGTVDVKDDVNIGAVNMLQHFDTGPTPVPGTSWLGSNWASIAYNS